MFWGARSIKSMFICALMPMMSGMRYVWMWPAF
jgi:hypothetical protein